MTLRTEMSIPVYTEGPQPKPKKTEDKNQQPVPVGQPTNNNETEEITPQGAKSETSALDRVKKEYHQKGFWAAVGAYLREAFSGPPPEASAHEREAYNASTRYVDSRWIDRY